MATVPARLLNHLEAGRIDLATYLAGSIFTAASANLLSGVQVKTKQSDNSLPNNTTTFTSDGELILPVLASSRYALICCLQYDSSATADIAIDFLVPSGSSGNYAPFGLDVGVGAGVSSGTIVTIASAIAGGAAAVGGTNVGTRQLMIPIGNIVTGPTAGNVQLQFAQRVSDASTTTLRAGSWMALLLSQ